MTVPRAVIVGGSLAGLFVGLALREVGWDVEVFERSPHELEGRGAGIVAQPELLRFLEERGVSSREGVGVPARARRYLRRDGSVAREEREDYVMTSWGALYRPLREALPDDRYRQGSELVSSD